jgi:hypothetical protein
MVGSEIREGAAVNEQTRRILEVKRTERDRLAALPFARKLEILDQLRARSLELSRTTLRRPGSHRGGGTKSA